MKRNHHKPNDTILAVTFACGILSMATDELQAQHIHINAGAVSTRQDAQLQLANAAAYDVNAGYDVYLTLASSGYFSNLYQGAGVTFTALASTPDNGGPASGHAAEGTFLQLQFVSLSAPPGGEFGIWVRDPDDPVASTLLFNLPAGTTNGTNRLSLSEGDGSIGSDPYGHIHGRTFTATKPGLYKLGCRVVDTSINGTGGGPIHTPSDVYQFYFQAGPTISSWARSGDEISFTFGTTRGKTYYLESTANLSATNWTTLAGPFTGNNFLQTATTPYTTSTVYFRLRNN